MGAAMSAKAPQNRQTGGAYTDGDSKAYREAFTEEVCDALYLKAPRLVKRLQRVPTRDVRLAGRACKYSAVLMRGVYPWDPTKPCQDSFFVNESMVVDGLASHWFAVMDGHGPDGDGCAHFIRDNLEKVARKLHKKHPDWSWADVLSNSYETVNAMLHRSDSVSSVDSGSTLVSVCIRRDVCYCANVGDSRAIIGTLDRSTGRCVAKPLSSDQTPYRKDERERLRECGARVLTIDQLQGRAPLTDDYICALGDEIDEGGDPPRVFLMDDDVPGTACSPARHSTAGSGGPDHT